MKQRPITKSPLNISHISFPTVMVEGKGGRCKTLNYKVGKIGVKNSSKKNVLLLFSIYITCQLKEKETPSLLDKNK